MVLLYNLCRWVNTALLWLPIKLYRPDVALISKQFEKGLNRITFWTKGQVVSVQRHNPDGPSTFFAVKQDDRIVGMHFCALFLHVLISLPA